MPPGPPLQGNNTAARHHFHPPKLSERQKEIDWVGAENAPSHICLLDVEMFAEVVAEGRRS